MYFHTSYPDAGWDMAQLISDSKVSDKYILLIVVNNVSVFLLQNMLDFLKTVIVVVNMLLLFLMYQIV